LTAAVFFGEETLSAGVTVKNTGTKPMFFHYYMGFSTRTKSWSAPPARILSAMMG
jgi:hypothetical protein